MTDSRRDAAPTRVPWVLIGAAALLLCVGAWNHSLWLDELHTLFHSRAEGLRGFFESVRTDNHPPLSFLLVRWSCHLFGESHLGLRLPSILAGLVALLQVQAIARRLPGTWPVAGWLYLGSSYGILIHTEARMYALLSLSVLGLVASCLDGLEGRRSPWRATPWVVLGMHSHYYFALTSITLLAWLAGLAWKCPRRRARVLRLVLAVGLGGLFFLPWFFWGFRHQIGSSLAPGDHLTSLGAWFESLAHLLFIGVGEAYPFLRLPVFLPGLVAASGLVLLALGLLRRPGASGPEQQVPARTVLVLLLVVGIGTPLVARLGSAVVPKLAYNWRYIAGSLGPLMLILAAGCAAPGRLARVLGVITLVTLYVATAFALVTPGREDYRGATRFILHGARAGDVVLINPAWAPVPSRSPNGYDFYAQRLPASEGSAPPSISTDSWREALEHPRVWAVVRRYFPPGVLAGLRQEYTLEEVTPISLGISVHLFTR